MSTPGDDYDASLEPKEYFCYVCNRNVIISASPAAAGELFCPGCRTAFLEEVTVAGPTIHSFPFVLMPTASSPSRSSSSSTAAPSSSDLSNFITSFLDLQDGRRARSRSGSGVSSAAGTSTPENEPESFDPLVFFQDYIRRLEEGGANIEVLLDGARVDLTPGILRDYVDGPGLEQLMQHIAENNPNRRATLPATKLGLSTLSDVVMTKAMVEAAEGAECAVCKEDLLPGDGAKKLPCKHIYHTNCILRWLGLRNSCPICRFHLRTDDPDGH